jgi:methyl-CpG-binding domain protein 4
MAGDPHISDDEGCELSAYELQRLEHIKRNHAELVRLGLVEARSAFNASMGVVLEDNKVGGIATRPKRPRTKQSPAEATRRSARARGIKPDYTGETIDNFGDELARIVQRGKKRSSRAKNRQTDAEREADHARMVEESQRWLAQSRAALLKLRGLRSEDLSQGQWREEAVRRWGDRVSLAENAAEEVDWADYCLSRMTDPPPPSPLDLLQEYYAHCPWRLLTACVLMSRVSSWETKHRAVSAFFKRFPDPSAAIEVDETSGAREDLRGCISPLGLFDSRSRAVAAVARRFLEMPVFACGLDKPRKIYGIGVFGVDSYRIFCRGEANSLRPSDRTLQAFCRWMKTHANTAGSDDSNETERGLTCADEAGVDADSSSSRKTKRRRRSASGSRS